MNGMLMLKAHMKKSDREPVSKSQKTRRTIWKSGFLFLGLVALTFYVIFKGSDMKELLKILESSKLGFVLCGCACVAVYLVCDAVNLRRILASLDYNVTLGQALKYAGTGFFFSGITPSSTGGQPMQIFYMFYDNVHISHGSVTLMLDLISYEVVTIAFAVTGLIAQHSILFRAQIAMRSLIIAGMAVNILLLLFLIAALFAPIISQKLVMGVVNKLMRFKWAKRFDIRKRAQEQLNEYQETGKVIGQDAALIAKVLITSAVQVTGLYSTTFFAFRALGIDDFSFFTIITLQAVVSVGMSFIPLPGSVGANEGGFLFVFSVIVPQALLEPTLILSRGISFYLMMGAAGLIIAYNYFRGNLIPKKEDRRGFYEKQQAGEK
jgi:conserved hypothetical protein